MKVLEFRLARLERTGNGLTQRCFVGIPAGTTHNEEVVREAIADHRRRTGWTGRVMRW